MKKLLSLIIGINFLIMPAYSMITDDFAEQSIDKSLKIKTYEYKPVQDDFVNNSLDKNLKINYKKPAPVTDNFAERNTNKNIAVKKQGAVQEVLPAIDTQKVANRKKVILDTSSATEVPVRICQMYSTKYKIDEGDYIDFETTKDIVIQGKTYTKGTIVKGRVENISLNQTMGVPSDLVIGNFKISNIPLSGEINKTGANRSLWVKPCSVGLSIFWGAGLLLIPIRGGHAKIHPSETYTLYAN